MRRWLCLVALGAVGCTTAGSTWMAQPLPGDEDLSESMVTETEPQPEPTSSKGPEKRAAPRPTAARGTHVLGTRRPPQRRAKTPDPKKLEGRVLGKFRNTYYDFPSEADYEGKLVELMSAKCNVIKKVPKGFHDAVCVQGSGMLTTGATVSFNRRDCECAAVCPRTEQKICFDELNMKTFPWGRGATGKAITPLLTVAVDSSVIPMNTALYIPEYDGVPRDPGQTSLHDGCFIAQDRGMKVKGKHVDLFTGQKAITEMWNELVPSNSGVTVVLDSPRCERVGAVSLER